MEYTGNEASAKSYDKKEKVFDAARKRFLHYGYKKTTIDEIAVDAEISKASIYQYFDGKEDILIQMIDSEKRQLQRYLFGKIRDEADPMKKLELLMSEALDYLDEHPFLMRTLRRDPEIVSPRLMERVFEIEKRYIAIVEIYVKETLEARNKPADASKFLAYTFYKMFEAFSFASSWDDEDGKMDNEMVVKLVRNAMTGIIDNW